MELNKNVETFIVDDWMGNVLGEYDSFDKAEEHIQKIVENDEEVKLAKAYLEMVEKQLANEKITKSAEDALEELETQVFEDLGMYGIDYDGNKVGIEWG